MSITGRNHHIHSEIFFVMGDCVLMAVSEEDILFFKKRKA